MEASKPTTMESPRLAIPPGKMQSSFCGLVLVSGSETQNFCDQSRSERGRTDDKTTVEPFLILGGALFTLVETRTITISMH